ncbi:MAG TPA: hypothetical protein VFX49_02305 [Chloroflexota bacterium]|nr:hypothetical protein [Chloroflexota bacterium]
MHPHLRATIETFTELFREDTRCIGLHLKGSGGAGTDDEYSDVDLELVVEDGDYEAVSAEMRDLCERVCGRIYLWFPEGVRADGCNYAFLFEHDGEQFLYDFALATRSAVLRDGRRPGEILFDRAGVLAELRETRGPAVYKADRLRYTINHYWIYAYLSGKYARRGDVWKLLYVQQTIFRAHLQVLGALHPEMEWGWWARDVAGLPEETQAALRRYFPAPEVAAIREALGEEVRRFGEDARAACAKWGQEYPEGLETYVVRHLREMGAIPVLPG